MKLKSLIITVLFAGASILFSACGQKKDPSEEAFDALMERVPAGAAFFAGGFIPLEEQIDSAKEGNWNKVVEAINGNTALAERFEKSLSASPDVKYFFERWLCGVDPREMLEKACKVAPAPFAFVAYFDGNADACEKGEVPFIFAATMAKPYAEAIEHFLICCKKENEVRGHGAGTWTREVKGEKTLYVYSEEKISVVFAFCGNEVIVASSTDKLSDFEASASNPPAELLKDSAVFKKAANGVGAYNFVALLNFDEIKKCCPNKKDATPTEKILRETAESLSAFVNISLTEKTANALVRAEFHKPNYIHDLVASMAKNKLATLANALPGADYAAGLGIPKLSDELAKEAKIPEEGLDKLRRLDAQRLYVSLGNAKKIASAVSGDYMNLPDVFLKLDCGNTDVLLEDSGVAAFFDGNNPMAQKQSIDGSEVFSSLFFGIKYALLGKNSVYVSNLFDAPAALALAKGKGKSAEDTGTFNSLAEKLAGENALEWFMNDRTGTEVQLALLEYAQNNPELPAEERDGIRMAISFHELTLALTKKSISGIALRRNGTALELHWTCEYEYDFDAFAEGIKNLK